MDLGDCKALLAHAEWADAATWQSILRAGVDDKELRDKLLHLHQVQSVYLSIWRGEPLDLRPAESFPTPASMRDWAGSVHRALPAHLARLSDADVGRVVSYPWHEQLRARFGEPRDVTFGETVVQVATHSTYHRGQVARRLRELGVDPPLTDYIAWIWSGRPASTWE
jgi:uncharacterized damage-inducible protein DinB